MKAAKANTQKSKKKERKIHSTILDVVLVAIFVVLSHKKEL